MAPAKFLVGSVMTSMVFSATAGEGSLRGLGAKTPEFYTSVPGVQEMRGRVIVKLMSLAELREGRFDWIEADIATIRTRAEGLVNRQRVIHQESALDMFVVDTGGLEENTYIAQIMSKAQAQNGFAYIEPDYFHFPLSCPNDPGLSSQWHHDKSHLQSCSAWDITTGDPGVTVAICDTGLDLTHPDLSSNRVEGYNAVDKVWESAGGNVSNAHPHGTMCAGSAAAVGNNNQGVDGIGYTLTHRPVRVTNSDTGGAYMSDILHGVVTAADKGDKVISVSYSGVNSASVRSTATYVKSKGGLLVWAAGNDAANLAWGDRDADDIVVVGATTSADALASFSAYGQSVDLTAPGQSVVTTTVGGYATVSGTSFSTPFTAGLVGLIWSAAPTLTPNEVERVLKQSCDDKGSAGVDNTFGYGRINSFKALLAVANLPPTTTTTTGPLVCSDMTTKAACTAVVGCAWSGNPTRGSCGDAGATTTSSGGSGGGGGCGASGATCSRNSDCCTRCRSGRCQ